MLLFLDVISPIPEFFIIEDNKVILRRKIIKNGLEKLSDNIFETYIKINNNFNLTQNLKKIAMTVGPGSYTSLRVGSAFISALKISNQLRFCPISIGDILKFKSFNNNIEELGLYICSANNQNFFCILNKEKKIEYIKLDENNYILKKNIKKIFYNEKKFNSDEKNIIQVKLFFIDEIVDNYKKLNFLKDTIIKPIFISNNNLLN